MLENLDTLVADPILGLSAAFSADPNPQKVDLGVGIYKDESGNTPVMSAIKTAEYKYLEIEHTKAYTAPEGINAYNKAIQTLLFGDKHSAVINNRVSTLQTPGGCGALRLAAELIHRGNPNACVWLSNPSWANHHPLLESAGISIQAYPYYNVQNGTLRFEEMLSTLNQAKRGDLVLLHACCHNPTGADLTQEQWQAVAKLADKTGFIPFIDIAYQGFANNLELDAYGIRLLADSVPEMLIASSCSKNFGLYRERVGAVSVLANNHTESNIANQQLLSIARGIYSMPPAHGAALVATVLSSELLRKEWLAELDSMRGRMNSLRSLLVQRLATLGAKNDFSFIEKQFGMFSLLGFNAEQVQRLRNEFSIYMTGNSRINIAGINQKNVDYLAEAIIKVIP